MRWTFLLALLVCFGCNSTTDDLRGSKSESTTSDRDNVDRSNVIGDINGLSVAAQREIAKINMPVLLFGAPYDAASIVMSGEVWYAISVPTPEVVLSLHVTNKVHVTLDEEAAPFDETVRGVGARITDNDGIRGVSWEENGTQYVLEAECGIAEDQRCLKNDFVMGLANKMVRVK